MQNRSRFACRYIKSGGPQPDYGKERAEGGQRVRGTGWTEGVQGAGLEIGKGKMEIGGGNRSKSKDNAEARRAQRLAEFPVSIFQFPTSGPVGEEGVDGGVDPVLVEGVVAVF
jgi:hypothetical protein